MAWIIFLKYHLPNMLKYIRCMQTTSKNEWYIDVGCWFFILHVIIVFMIIPRRAKLCLNRHMQISCFRPRHSNNVLVHTCMCWYLLFLFIVLRLRTTTPVRVIVCLQFWCHPFISSSLKISYVAFLLFPSSHSYTS